MIFAIDVGRYSNSIGGSCCYWRPLLQAKTRNRLSLSLRRPKAAQAALHNENVTHVTSLNQSEFGRVHFKPECRLRMSIRVAAVGKLQYLQRCASCYKRLSEFWIWSRPELYSKVETNLTFGEGLRISSEISGCQFMLAYRVWSSIVIATVSAAADLFADRCFQTKTRNRLSLGLRRPKAAQAALHNENVTHVTSLNQSEFGRVHYSIEGLSI